MPRGICRTGIDYGEQAWNPAIGCDNPPSACAVHDHCWARLEAERGRGVYAQWAPGDRFAPRFLPERLDGPRMIAKPSRILVSFMGDLFGNWVPSEWIEQVLQVIRDCPRHSFLLLTKNARRYGEFVLPPNAWAGTTVTGENDVGRVGWLAASALGRRWVSYEPMLSEFDDHSWMGRIDWLVMGAQTGPGAEPCYREWVETAVGYAGNRRVPVFLKSNLHRGAKWAWPGELIQEYPEGMVGHE